MHGSGAGFLSQLLLTCKFFAFTNNSPLCIALREAMAAGGEEYIRAFAGAVHANHEKALEQLLAAGVMAATLKAGGHVISYIWDQV